MNETNCKLFLKNPSFDPITKKKIIKGKSTYNKWMNQSKEYGLIKETNTKKTNTKKKNAQKYHYLKTKINGPFIPLTGVDIVKQQKNYLNKKKKSMLNMMLVILYI